MLAFALASKKSSLPAPSGPKSVEQVLRELAVLGFSDIGKVVRWRPELVYEELEDADNLDQPVAPGASEPRPGHRQRDAAARGPPRGCRGFADRERFAREDARQAWAAGLDRQAPRHVRRPVPS